MQFEICLLQATDKKWFVKISCPSACHESTRGQHHAPAVLSGGTSTRIQWIGGCVGCKSSPDISGGEKKIFPQTVTSNSFYTRRLYVKPKGQNSVTRHYPPDCTNALVSKESTCGLRTTVLLHRTWRVADQAPNVHVLAPLSILIKDTLWTTRRTEQPNYGTHVLSSSNGDKQNKQPWKLICWCIYTSFNNTACYPADR